MWLETENFKNHPKGTLVAKLIEPTKIV